jgi:hypothetical protein
VKPRCYDCLTEDVAVKLIDDMGFEHWFCAEDWAAWERFGANLRRLLADAAAAAMDEALGGAK